MNTVRTTWKTYALGGVAVAALLSSTGCQGNDTPAGADASAPATVTSAAGNPGTSSSATPTDGTTGDATPTDGTTGDATPTGGKTGAGETGSGKTGSAPVPAGESPAASDGSHNGAKTTACTDENISVISKAEPHDSLRHLVLTATNIGDKTCTLYRYALLRFDEGSYDEVGPLESNSKAVATLAPGEKAYAGMRLFVAGEETRAVETLTLGFQGRDSADEIGSPIDVPLPDGTPFVNIGPTPGVTFWDTDLKSVQKFTFAR
ncbi:DUF4232 domain-containing protein [Streptomyces sp. NPDC017254]|uniref:DUF4232 domain-containing protein n=1 Tax=unclassified Streptomyces TaxID=2593676 RepID=UPI0037B82401